MAAGPVGVGIIGAGVIAGTYLENLTSFPDVTVHAVGDLRPDAAQTRAEEHGIAVHGDVSTVLEHPDVEIVVNLTIPAVHAEVSLAALAAGKHAYSEKPLSLDRASATTVRRAADEAGLRVGCAPDTFLGTGLQTAFRLIRQGDIGVPQTALALMQHWGAESWHPNPEFLFQSGGGPLFDLGPYYLTVLAQIFGPARAVAAVGSTAYPTRTIGSGPRAGQVFDVTVPTHHGLIVSYDQGGAAQAVFSNDAHQPRALVEITGTEGVLSLPDPNAFDGPIRRRRQGDAEWETVTETVARSTRGTGVLDLARAIREDRPHRADAGLAYHVLDLMASATESGEESRMVDVDSDFVVADLLPEDWDPYAVSV